MKVKILRHNSIISHPKQHYNYMIGKIYEVMNNTWIENGIEFTEFPDNYVIYPVEGELVLMDKEDCEIVEEEK